MKDTKTDASICAVNFQIYAHEGYMLMACAELPDFKYHKDMLFIPKGGQLLELFGCLSNHLAEQGFDLTKLAITDTDHQFKDVRNIPKAGIRLPGVATIKRKP